MTQVIYNWHQGEQNRITILLTIFLVPILSVAILCLNTHRAEHNHNHNLRQLFFLSFIADSPGPSAPCDPPVISEGAANDRPLAKKTKKNKPFRCNQCPKRLHSYDSCNRHICAQHYKEALEAWVGEGEMKCWASI